MEGDQQILKVKFPSSFGGHVVAIRTMDDCARGRHKKCPGGAPARPGEFGGMICQCPCHKGGIPPKKGKAPSKRYWKKLAGLAHARAVKLTREIEEAHRRTAGSTLNFRDQKTAQRLEKEFKKTAAWANRSQKKNILFAGEPLGHETSTKRKKKPSKK